MERFAILLGNPLGHSISPLLHETAYRAMGLDWGYVSCQIGTSDLQQAVGAVRTLNMAGANITVPYKEQAMQYIDILDSSAKTCGAVNTIAVQSGLLKGFNTDSEGFWQSFAIHYDDDLSGKKIFICGCGGAARAIAFNPRMGKAEKIYLVDTDGARLAKFTEEMTSQGLPAVAVENSEKEVLQLCDIAVNASPVGMKHGLENDISFNPALLPEGAIVCDIVYNPTETVLLRKAREAGMQTLGGLEMLVMQAALAIRIFAGQDAPYELMLEAARKKMQSWKG